MSRFISKVGFYDKDLTCDDLSDIKSKLISLGYKNYIPCYRGIIVNRYHQASVSGFEVHYVDPLLKNSILLCNEFVNSPSAAKSLFFYLASMTDDDDKVGKWCIDEKSGRVLLYSHNYTDFRFYNGNWRIMTPEEVCDYTKSGLITHY